VFVSFNSTNITEIAISPIVRSMTKWFPWQTYWISVWIIAMVVQNGGNLPIARCNKHAYWLSLGHSLESRNCQESLLFRLTMTFCIDTTCLILNIQECIYRVSHPGCSMA
jgi:hypothetical protein